MKQKQNLTIIFIAIIYNNSSNNNNEEYINIHDMNIF